MYRQILAMVLATVWVVFEVILFYGNELDDNKLNFATWIFNRILYTAVLWLYWVAD